MAGTRNCLARFSVIVLFILLTQKYKIISYMVELVFDENERSNWFTECSELCYIYR